MSRGLTAEFVAQLQNQMIYPFFTVSLQFDSGEINLWTGLYDLNVKGKVYTGAGDLLQVSTIEETAELAARGATLSLSGIDTSVISLALQEPYQGRECSIGMGVFNGFTEQGALLKDGITTEFILLESGGRTLLEGDLFHFEAFNGYMDTMQVLESEETSHIQMTVENRLIDLERSRVFRYNSASQQLRYPTDKGLNYIESTTDREVYWGVDRKG